MSIYQWFVFLLILQLIHGLGTWKLYEKAGRKSWEAFIPVYNSIVLMKIINRPTWWTLLLFIPIINLIMIPVVWVETYEKFWQKLHSRYLVNSFHLWILYLLCQLYPRCNPH
jgi:signal peptidase I